MGAALAGPRFKNKAQEKAWKKSFTPQDKANTRKLIADLHRLGPEGVARRDKAQHLEREKKDDDYAIGQAREQFKQAVELKHTMFDPNERLYRLSKWRLRVDKTRARFLPGILDAFCKLRCAVLGHRWSRTAFQDNAFIYKYHRKCERRGAVAAGGYKAYGCEARQEV